MKLVSTLAFGPALMPLPDKILLVVVLLFAMTPGVQGATDAEQSPDAKAAAAMSLAEARDIIQRGHRYSQSDGAADHPANPMEFNPKQMVDVSYSADGTRNVYRGCPYETFKPYVVSQVGAFPSGVHKGSPLYSALGGDWCNIQGNYIVEIHLPTAEQAQRVAIALLRWNMSTLAEREAFPDTEQQQFASIAAAYRSHTPRETIGEDVRRTKIAAETAVQDKRFSDAIDAYEDGLKLAPWWPEGHFNAALLLGDLHYYDEAVSHMKKYLALVPDAPDARAAQDRIYAWESRRKAEFQ
jgi:tetratricopeptide (TPR) repeat protein